MNSDDLTLKQTRTVSEGVVRKANYLLRLQKRMAEQQFPESDELYRLVQTAHSAMHDL